MTKYNKVTLIVENDEETVTVDIPAAIDITFGQEAVQVLNLFGDGRSRYQPDIMDLTFSMRAFFDEKDGYLFRSQTVTTAKPVEDFRTDADLHRHFAHPDYEYKTTEGPRKSWNDYSTPPDEDAGWERNEDAGRQGWERFDYHEESYWKRKKA